MNRTRIATAVTLLALGALTAVALASRPGEETQQPAAASAAPEEVRTQVVRRDRTVTQDAPAPRAAPAAPRAAAPAAPARARAAAPPAAAPLDTRGDGTPEDGPHDDFDDHGGDRDDDFDDHGGDRDDDFDDHGGDDDLERATFSGDDSGHGRGRGRGRGRGGDDD
jgi:hypothetical protein